MQLMSRKEVVAKQAEAKRLQIEEGAKIARQVDGVRETLAIEEQKLEQFRTKRVAEVYTEIAILSEKQGALAKEVEELERARAQLLLPLEAEWLEVAKAKQEAERLLQGATDTKQAIDTEQEELIAFKQQLTNREQVVIYTEQEAQKKLDSATMLAQEAKAWEEKAATTYRESQSHRVTTEANLAEAHRKLSMREQALEEKERAVEEQRQQNLVEKLKIRDERATLERALKRFSKK